MIPERIGDLLAHLFMHQIHHRGQVHAMLSGTSVKPPQLDEFFLDYDLKLRSERLSGWNCNSGVDSSDLCWHRPIVDIGAAPHPPAGTFSP